MTDATDATPLIGVTIRAVGTTTGTVTDVDGKYRIELTDTVTNLAFSYLGMAPRVLALNGRRLINVSLQPVGMELDGVVVTGYRGAQTRRDLVGSYAEVSTEELAADRPVESIDALLEGRVAGVRVQTVTGEPGLPIRIDIRGQSSLPVTGGNITASTQPLYVLDGVPLYDVLETNTTGTIFSDLNNQLLNPLAFINPDDVESIVVLKDASATALYGADASNGVVLITTKSGAAGKTKVSFSASYGTGRPINEIQFLNTAQYIELARETLFNDGLNPALAGAADVETDWRGLVLQNPTNTDIDLALSGGQGDITYRLSAGYNLNESVHKRNGLEQGNLNLNLRFPVNDRIILRTRLSGAVQHKESLRSFGAFTFPPNLPVRNPDGSFNNDGFFERRPNPVALLEQNENYHDSYNLNGRITLNYRATKSIDLRLLAGVDQQQRDQFQYRSALNGSGALSGGRLIQTDSRNLQWISNGQATWSPEIGGNHHLNSLLGGELQRQRQERSLVSGDGFPFDDLRRIDVLPDANVAAASNVFETAQVSGYGEVAYDYDYRYYLKLNGRRDASSIFGGDQQADLFWAAGAAWGFSAEPGLKDRLPLGVSYGKLRASYGVTGNSRLGVYTTGGVYRQEFFDENYGGALPALVAAPANDLLGWERKRQTSLGLDLAWPEDYVRLTLEYYSNRTIDGIVSFDTPRESGFSSIVGNGVSLRNYGFEATIRYQTARDRRLRYHGSFNFARNRNELLSLDFRDVPRSTQVSQFIVGQDINLIYGIPFAGVNTATGVAEYRLPDGTVTSERSAVIDPQNYVPIGRGVPDFYGGWHQGLSYGAFELTLQLNYSYGGDELVDRLTFTDGQQILINNQSVNQLDRWQRPGDVAPVPRLSIDNPPVSRSSRYVFRANYLQFSALSLSVDPVQLGWFKQRLRSAKVYVLVNNLGYLYDERRREDRNGVAEYRFTFPQQRAVVVGLKVGL